MVKSVIALWAQVRVGAYELVGAAALVVGLVIVGGAGAGWLGVAGLGLAKSLEHDLAKARNSAGRQ